jgi:hypothetical protein
MAGTGRWLKFWLRFRRIIAVQKRQNRFGKLQISIHPGLNYEKQQNSLGKPSLYSTNERLNDMRASKRKAIERYQSAPTVHKSKLPPTLAQIRQRAHEIYLARSGAAGHELDDWLQAERELKAGKYPQRQPDEAKSERTRMKTMETTEAVSSDGMESV